MKNPIVKIQSFFERYGFWNLYGNDSFYDKEATINEYLNLYPESNGNYQTYDQLYEDALSCVGKVSFKEKTKNMDDFFIFYQTKIKLLQ